MEQLLTSKQQFWCNHILAAQRSQVSYTEYAKQHSLNLKALYYWSMTLRRKGLLDQLTSDFIELKLEQTPPARSSQVHSARTCGWRMGSSWSFWDSMSKR